MSHKSILRIVIEPMVVAVIAGLALRTIVCAFSIPSASMDPTLLAGDHVLVTPYDGPLWHLDPARGDVIVFRRDSDSQLFIKRIIALPNESIEVRNRDVLVGDRVLTESYLKEVFDNGALPSRLLPRNAYFVMGDNRLQSLDSRAWGTVDRKSIVGRARLIFWSNAGVIGDGATASASTGESRGPTFARPDVRWRRILSLIH